MGERFRDGGGSRKPPPQRDREDRPGRRPGCEWEGAVRAHREAFAGVDPATTTLYVAGFIPPGVAEVELDAVLAAPPR